MIASLNASRKGTPLRLSGALLRTISAHPSLYNILIKVTRRQPALKLGGVFSGRPRCSNSPPRFELFRDEAHSPVTIEHPELPYEQRAGRCRNLNQLHGMQQALHVLIP